MLLIIPPCLVAQVFHWLTGKFTGLFNHQQLQLINNLNSTTLTAFCLWSNIIFSTIPLVSSSKSPSCKMKSKIKIIKNTNKCEYKKLLKEQSISILQSHPSFGFPLTLEFSGWTFFVLISGSVETSLDHHSILLTWQKLPLIVNNWYICFTLGARRLQWGNRIERSRCRGKNQHFALYKCLMQKQA